MKSEDKRIDSEGKKASPDSHAEKENSLKSKDKTPADPFGDFFNDYTRKLQGNPLLTIGKSKK